MKKWILPLFLLSSFSLAADEPASSLSNSLLTYTDWRKIAELSKCDTDVVIFYDGTKICGRFDKVPALQFSFGMLNFNTNELAIIAYQHDGNQKKAQYITKNGENYVGDISEEKLVFWAFDSSSENPNELIPKKLDPNAIKFIIFTDRLRDSIAASRYPLHSLEMKNGNHFPVILSGEPIHLHDGDRNFKIKTNDIVDISFNGGLHGYVNFHGRVQELDFSFVEDKYVTVKLMKNAQTLQLPWNLVARIQGNNGGFNQEELSSALNLQTVQKQASTSAGVKAINVEQTAGITIAKANPDTILIASAENVELPPPVLPRLPQPKENTSEAFVKPISSIGVPRVQDRSSLPKPKAVSLEEMLQQSALEQAQQKTLENASELVPQKTHQPENQYTEKLTAFEISEITPLTITPPYVTIFDDFNVQNSVYEDKSLRVDPKVQQTTSKKPNRTVGIQKIPKNETLKTKKTIKPKPVIYIEPTAKNPGFYIEKSPVTNAQYFKFVKATHRKTPAHWINGKIPKGFRNKPVVNISYEDAQAYADWAGKVLPSQSELIRAQKADNKIKWQPQLKEWTSTALIQEEDDEEDSGTTLQVVFNSRTGSKDLHGNLKNPDAPDPQICFRCISISS